MNVRIEAGSMIIGVKAVIAPPVISTKVAYVGIDNHSSLIWTCLSPVLSINGHSLNAINPDLFKAGELTTSALA